MSLTNSQHDTIMRMYDSIQAKNRHIHETRYNEIISQSPEYQDIENKIIDLSIKAAAERISNENNVNNYSEQINALEHEKSSILAALGKPENYLNPVYDCAKCKDTGYIGSKKCSCFTRKAIDLVYSASNLKNITENENFATFSYNWYNQTETNPINNLTPYDNIKKVVKSCQDFITNFDKNDENLLLFGDTGTGKTFLSNCIAKELLDSSHSVIYLTAIELFSKFEKKDFKNSAYSEKDEFDIDYLLDCDLLIIDDLGTEISNTYTNSRLFYVINERILRKKSVMISTNLSLKGLRDTYSERIFSRITSSYIILTLFGDDIRTLKRSK